MKPCRFSPWNCPTCSRSIPAGVPAPEAAAVVSDRAISETLAFSVSSARRKPQPISSSMQPPCMAWDGTLGFCTSIAAEGSV
jgi:hypothetical protein